MGGVAGTVVQKVLRICGLDVESGVQCATLPEPAALVNLQVQEGG